MGCRETAIARHSAAEQGGTISERRNEAQEERAKARQTAKEYLDSTSFLQCCWEILVFRTVREAAETAMGLIIWGQLSSNLVETCRFPTTLARIHILHEATTPEYRDHYDDVEDLDEYDARVPDAVRTLGTPWTERGAEPCWFCSSRVRRTCYHCNAGLCRTHARRRYRFSL